MNNRRWTQEEDQYLIDSSLEYKEIAEHLGRSYPAVVQRIKFLGIGGSKPRARSNWSDGRRLWTEEENNFLRSNSNGVLTLKQMAQHLDRSWTAVAMHLSDLNLTTGRVGGYWDQDGNHLALEPQYYGLDWHKSIRLEILDRDSYTCKEPDCGFYCPSGSDLQIHHIVRRRLTMDDSPRNLVTLCRRHHTPQLTHSWESFSYDMLELLPEYQQFIYNGGSI